MGNNAYIKLVPGSARQSISTEDVKALFQYYKDITSKTGRQLGWEYEGSSFPYELKEKEEAKEKWFYLQSTADRYNLILVGVDKEALTDENGDIRTQEYIQLTLPESATAGDKAKANEFSRFLARKLAAELHLFNGRIMYFNTRK